MVDVQARLGSGVVIFALEYLIILHGGEERRQSVFWDHDRRRYRSWGVMVSLVAQARAVNPKQDVLDKSDSR